LTQRLPGQLLLESVAATVFDLCVRWKLTFMIGWEALLSPSLSAVGFTDSNSWDDSTAWLNAVEFEAWKSTEWTVRVLEHGNTLGSTQQLDSAVTCFFRIGNTLAGALAGEGSGLQ